MTVFGISVHTHKRKWFQIHTYSKSDTTTSRKRGDSNPVRPDLSNDLYSANFLWKEVLYPGSDPSNDSGSYFDSFFQGPMSERGESNNFKSKIARA